MKLYLAADHAGYELKEQVKAYLKGLGYQVEDEGAYIYEELDDYPDYVKIAAKRVAGDPTGRGLIFGASGQGEAMAANRYQGVRAAVYSGGGSEIINLSRQHNDANILSIGARFVPFEQAKEMIKLWLTTEFGREERHRRRIAKLDVDEGSAEQLIPEF